MSFVWCVGNGSKVLVYSDGRVVTGNGVVCTEEYKKIIRISSQVAVGYAGDVFFTKLVLEKTRENIKNLNDIKTIEEYYDKLRGQFSWLQELNTDQKGSFIIGGASRDHEYGIITFGTEQKEPLFVYPNRENRIVYASISNSNNDIGKKILKERLIQMIKEKNVGLTDSDYYKMMRPLLIEVAEVDNTVNSKMYREIIKIDK